MCREHDIRNCTADSTVCRLEQKCLVADPDSTRHQHEIWQGFSPTVARSREHAPGELRPVGGCAGRRAEVDLGRERRQLGGSRVLGAGGGDASHVGECVRGRVDETEPDL